MQTRNRSAYVSDSHLQKEIIRILRDESSVPTKRELIKLEKRMVLLEAFVFGGKSKQKAK